MSSAPTINAIPTEYAGEMFRSRLEARWAIFFDRMKIKWEYEPEGYTDGETMYLPDFWLPDFDCFFEIKPGSYDDTKARMLVDLTGKTCYVAMGPPAKSEDQYHVEDSMHVLTPQGWDNFHQWCACPHCKKLGIQYSGWGGRICWSRCWKLPKSVEWGGTVHDTPLAIANHHEHSCGRSDEISAAMEFARSYRFVTSTSPVMPNRTPIKTSGPYVSLRDRLMSEQNKS